MKRTTRLFIVVGCIVLMIISWIVVIGSKSNTEKQVELLSRASEYVSDEVFILAAPLLEEAAGYNAAHTFEAETALKNVYLNLMNQRGVSRKYTDLLEKQMNRETATYEVFLEAADFYLEDSKYADAYNVLKRGIEKTDSNELIELYEATRYQYRMGYETYEDVTEIHGNMISVSIDGLWGIADYDGKLRIPCEYEKISTFSVDRAIVRKKGVIYAIDSSNNRLALLKENVSDFGNYSDNRISLLTDDGWKRASGSFEMGSVIFEQIGTYTNGYAAAKENGKWGLVDMDTEWLIPAEYDSVIMDELGRSYAQGAAFVKKGKSVYLFVDGIQIGDSYDDAKPFNNEGYAAVKKNGKWGFVDTAGELKIDYKFEDAMSFGQHLAAVKDGEFWGYAGLQGEIVIEPIFLQAGSFVSGCAPVLTERGWQFISLLEYQKGARL